MYALSQEVLRTDISGMPLEWIDYRDAVRLYFMGQVAYSFGSSCSSCAAAPTPPPGGARWSR
jgi:hypothetical protein